MAQTPVSTCTCPQALPAWDGRDIDLGGHAVHRIAMPTPFSMPMAFDLYRQRQQQELERLELHESSPGLVLMRTGLWRGEVMRLLTTDTHSLSRHVQRLPSPYWVRAVLHHGGIGTLRRTITAMQSALFDSGKTPKALFLAYLTCPVCAEARGGEQILALRHWVPNQKLTAKLQKRAS
ncbi:MAG: hypothetical protein OEW08_09385 [Gammaproteobacteria bacterium]|nr:hypothetical protein [Gammaproteobacteria bacterium]